MPRWCPRPTPALFIYFLMDTRLTPLYTAVQSTGGPAVMVWGWIVVGRHSFLSSQNLLFNLILNSLFHDVSGFGYDSACKSKFFVWKNSKKNSNIRVY
jgi:hypothetical protein